MSATVKPICVGVGCLVANVTSTLKGGIISILMRVDTLSLSQDSANKTYFAN
jgi:hypothetical protein